MASVGQRLMQLMHPLHLSLIHIFDGNGTRQALEILHILNCSQQSRRVIQACFFDALFGLSLIHI